MSNKISLCMIVGNVAEYIERCLRSFAPVADEIVLVRAIGAAKPDDTQAIAMRVCRELGKPLVWAEYKNKPEHADWPHVDNFAAARQMSFDLASNDYCFWCDSDDTLESGAEFVREHAAAAKFDAYVFPYKISTLGVSIPRERLVNRRAGRWQYPVHECFTFNVEPVSGPHDDRVVIAHAPLMTKTGSNERNLRILRSIPDSEMHPGLLYHLHGELQGIGDIEGSIKAAMRAFEDPRLGRPERYEMLLNIARMTTDPAQRETLLHEAYKTDPTRREALGSLSGNALDFGKPDLALAYAQQMRATPPPRHTDWNNRKHFYGYVGTDIYCQALRANGMTMEAETIRRDALMRAGGCKISLLHATRGRPQGAVIARKLWYDLADHPDEIEHIFAFDNDDADSHCLRRFNHVELQPGGGCVAAWNAAAAASLGQVLIQLSDDWTPVQGWDTLILNRLGDLKQPRVLAISDGHRNDDLLCMAICTRAYYGQDCFLFHPEFTGVYSDNWFTELAHARGQVIQARDIVFDHRHPIFTGKPMDATHAAQNAPERYVQGKAVLEKLRAAVDWSSVPGFFNFPEFYDKVAARVNDGDTLAEVGVWFGRSVIYLAQACKRAGKRVKIYAVDTFKGEDAAIVARHNGSVRRAFEANLQRCGVADMIEVVESDSAAAAALVPDGLAFAFIDAAHDYESVKRDLAAWIPKVKPGGMIAGHDSQHEPVMRAVIEALPNAKQAGWIWFNEL